MPGGIGIDTPTAPIRSIVEHRSSQGQHLFLGAVQVRNLEVQVKLLRPGRIGPERWPVIRHTLEGQDEGGRRVQRRPVVAEHPSLIPLINDTAEEALVELGKFRRVGAIQHHTLQVSDHVPILETARVLPARVSATECSPWKGTTPVGGRRGSS